MVVAEKSTLQLPAKAEAQIVNTEPAVVPEPVIEAEPVVEIVEVIQAPETTPEIVEAVEEVVQDFKEIEPTPEVVNVTEEAISEPKVVVEATIEEPKIETIKSNEVTRVVDEITVEPKVAEPVSDIIEPTVEIVENAEEPVQEPTIAVTSIVEDTMPLPATTEVEIAEPIIVVENTIDEPAVGVSKPTNVADEPEPEEVVQVTESTIAVEKAVEEPVEIIEIAEELVQEPAPTEPQAVVEFASTTTPRPSALNDASEFRADTADDDGIIRDFAPQAPSGGDFFAGLSNATDRIDEELVTQIEGNSFTIQEALPDSIDESTSNLAPIFEIIAPFSKPVIQPETKEIETVKTFADLTPKRAISVNFEDWELEIPFLMADAVTQGNLGAFPVITAVRQGADLGFSGAWIKPGVIIYSIDQLLLPPADDVPAFLIRSFGNRAPNSISTVARVSTGPGAKAEDAPLQLSFSRTLRLSNGLAIKQRFANKRWQLVVTQIPQTGTENIQINDVLLNDLGLGLQLASLNDFTQMMSLTKSNGVDTAEITIQRGNTTEVAFLKF